MQRILNDTSEQMHDPMSGCIARHFTHRNTLLVPLNIAAGQIVRASAFIVTPMKTLQALK